MVLYGGVTSPLEEPNPIEAWSSKLTIGLPA